MPKGGAGWFLQIPQASEVSGERGGGVLSRAPIRYRETTLLDVITMRNKKVHARNFYEKTHDFSVANAHWISGNDSPRRNYYEKNNKANK